MDEKSCQSVQIIHTRRRVCHTQVVVLKNLGASSWSVAYVLKSERDRQRLSLRDLSARMSKDVRLSHSTLSEIERGDRRVTVDDLTVLAVALGISPATFLMPVWDRTTGSHVDEEETIQLTGTPGTSVRRIVDWVRGDAPLNETADAHEIESFRRGALPKWLWHEEGGDG